jgi:hypothetical protein
MMDLENLEIYETNFDCLPAQSEPGDDLKESSALLLEYYSHA